MVKRMKRHAQRMLIKTLCLVGVTLSTPPAIGADPTPLEFGIVSQRSPVLTARYWNPIIRYVSEKSGVPLRVKIGKSGQETSEMIRRGDVDFIYSNHIFHPDNVTSGFYVIAKDNERDIAGQIVVGSNSPVRTLSDLAGKTVVFPSKVAFVGYVVPIHEIRHHGIVVNEQFAGNQEGAMGQLRAGKTDAIGVNSEVMKDFAAREDFPYRIIWSSKPHLSMPVAAKPTIPKAVVDKVRDALIGMRADPAGAAILEESARIVGQVSGFGFNIASDHQYSDQRKLYREVIAGQ